MYDKKMGKLLFVILMILILLPQTIFAMATIDEVNQKVCNRFEEDTARLAGIMDEVRARKGITETRVAFGGIDDQIKSADYQITYAAEAIAFQRAQKYSSTGSLRSSLEALRGKVIRAKSEVQKALND